MNNKSKKSTCTSLERTKLRQFFLATKIVIKTSVVHFPCARGIPTGLGNTKQPASFTINFEIKSLEIEDNIILWKIKQIKMQ